MKSPILLQRGHAEANDRWKRQAIMRIKGGGFVRPQATRENGRSAARGGGAILRLVAQTLFVAVFFHPLAAFVFCDF